MEFQHVSDKTESSTQSSQKVLLLYFTANIFATRTTWIFLVSTATTRELHHLYSGRLYHMEGLCSSHAKELPKSCSVDLDLKHGLAWPKLYITHISLYIFLHTSIKVPCQCQLRPKFSLSCFIPYGTVYNFLIISTVYTGPAWLIRTRLIRSSTLFEVSVKCFPIISCLKCMLNSYFHLFRRKSLPTNDFKVTMPELWQIQERY